MRTTLIFNSNLESLSDYMTRVTAIIRAIRDNVPAVDGIDYRIELSEDEQYELYQQALTLAVEEMERTTGKHCIRKHNFGQDEEDFISNYKIVISDNLLSFNDSSILWMERSSINFPHFLVSFIRGTSTHLRWHSWSDKRG